MVLGGGAVSYERGTPVTVEYRLCRYGEELLDVNGAALVEIRLLHQCLRPPLPEQVIPDHLLDARAQLSLVDGAATVLVEACEDRFDCPLCWGLGGRREQGGYTLVLRGFRVEG